MTRARLLLVPVLAAGCGPSAAPPSDEAVPPPASIAAADPVDVPADVDLPALRAVGAPPPAAERVEVVVRADGSLVLAGEPVSLEELRTGLTARARLPGLGEHEPSPVHLIVTADAACPWVHVQWALQTAAHPDVAMYRVHFAARSRGGDGDVGTFALYLPSDRGVRPPSERHSALRSDVRVRGGTPDVDPWRLHRSLAERVASSEVPVLVQIDASRATRTGYVLRIADMAFAAGAAACMLVGTPPPGSALAAARPEDTPGDGALQAPGLTLDAAPATPPPFAASPGEFTGFAIEDPEVTSLLPEEELELEER